MGQIDELEQAELGLIGSTIQSAGTVLSELNYDPTDLRHPLMEQTWRIMSAMRHDDKPIDVVTLSNELSTSDMPVDPALLYRSLEAPPSAASATYYASIVSEHAARRRLATVGRAITDMAQQPGNIDNLIDQARKRIDQNTRVNTTSTRSEERRVGKQNTNRNA